LPPPHIELVWKDLQRHNFEGVLVPIRKTKFDIVIFGIRLNFAVVSFPHFPDWEPKPKLLVSYRALKRRFSTETLRGGRGPQSHAEPCSAWTGEGARPHVVGGPVFPR
jgi:hypothetical protein